MNQDAATQLSRRKDFTRSSAPRAFFARAVLGACIGSTVAFYGHQAAALAPHPVPDQLRAIAFLAAAVSLTLILFLKIQMTGIAAGPRRVRVQGKKQEIFVRRRPEVLAWILRRWIVFFVCVAATLAALFAGLAHYNVPLPVEPVQQAMAQVARMGQDLTLLVYALVLGCATLFLSETTLRITAKTGLRNQAAWIYLPAIGSMTATLLRLGSTVTR